MRLFKDIYKKANDSIPTDAAKERVMARIQANKTESIKYKRVFEVIAVAACLAFTVAAVRIYDSFISIGNPTEVVSTNETAVQNTQPTNEDKNVVNEKTEVLETKATEVTQPIKRTVDMGSKTESKVNGEIKPDRTETAAEITDVPSAETVIAVNEGIELNGGVGAAVASVYVREAESEREVSVSEYYDYLGKNIEECVVLPEGFESITQESAYLEVDESGNYVNDEWSFVFQNEEKIAEIKTTKHTETVQEYVDSEDYLKSTVCGTDAVVIKDETIYKAYMVSEEIGYTVTSNGLEEAEVEDMLVSLVK